MIKSLRYLIFKFVYGNISKIDSPVKFKDITVKNIYFNKNISYKYFRIPSCRLYTDTINNTAFIRKDSLLREVSYQFKLKKNLQIVNGPIKENFVIKNGTPKIISRFDGNVFSLLSGGAAKNNYWHWVFDVLPKFGILEKIKNKNKIDYFLLPSTKKDYQVASIQELGISKKKILDSEIYKHILCKSIISVDHPIIFNNNPSKSIQNIPDWIIKWLRKSFIKKRYNKNNYPKKIFISRVGDSNLDKRRLINNEEVENFLQKSGFTSVVLSNYAFKDQIRLFQNASFIVGLHGAGFANLVFAKNKAKIIEIKSAMSGNVITNLAYKCNLNYKSYIDRKTSSINHQDSHTRVNLNEFKKMVLSFEKKQNID